MATPVHAYIVREELNVSREVDRTARSHPLAESIFESAKWRIAREPNCGTPVEEVNGGRRLLNLPPNKIAKTPGLLVRYFLESRDTMVIDWVRYYPYDDATAVNPAAYVR